MWEENAKNKVITESKKKKKKKHTHTKKHGDAGRSDGACTEEFRFHMSLKLMSDNFGYVAHIIFFSLFPLGNTGKKIHYPAVNWNAASTVD